MDSMNLLLIVWAVLTTVLVVVLIYRSTLSMHEDDQLFLDEAESHMEREQQELRVKLNKVTPLVNWLGAASGALILFIGVMWLWHGISQM
jgi:beta-lactamase regulating signal transducer with metallopeptidase domain